MVRPMRGGTTRLIVHRDRKPDEPDRDGSDLEKGQCEPVLLAAESPQQWAAVKKENGRLVDESDRGHAEGDEG